MKKYDDAKSEGVHGIAYPEKNMLITAGKGNIRAFDTASNIELAKLLIDGSARDMTLSSDKSKLLVSSTKKNKEGNVIYQYYLFDIEHTTRKFHDIEGKLYEVNK